MSNQPPKLTNEQMAVLGERIAHYQLVIKSMANQIWARWRRERGKPQAD